MESIAKDLSAYLVNKLSNTDSRGRLLVGISGIPASGKSTFARLIVAYCNEALSSDKTITAKTHAILVGLDGWHLTRAQLDAFPNPKLAHDRRGAHWTFDGKGYASFVASLRIPTNLGVSTIAAPAFDHAVKDPEPDAIRVLPEHRIVVIEGLYTFLSIEPWKTAGELLDERWFIDVGIEEASKRLVKRHVVTGVAKDMEEARWRSEQNDMPNGRFIINNMLAPTRRIPSVNDPAFVSEIVNTPEPQ